MIINPELALLYHLGALPPSIRGELEGQLSDPAVRRALRMADPVGLDLPEPLEHFATKIAAEVAEIRRATAIIRALESQAEPQIPDAAVPSSLAVRSLGGLEYETAFAGAAATGETHPIPTGDAFVDVAAGVLVIEYPDAAVPYAAIRVTVVVDGRALATTVRRMTFDSITRTWQLRLPTAEVGPASRPVGPVRYAVQPATDELLEWFDPVAVRRLLAAASGAHDTEGVRRLTALLERLESGNDEANPERC